MKAKVCMQEAMRTSVFVRVRKRQLVANRVLLQKLERVTETDIVIPFWELNRVGRGPNRT